MIRPCKHLKHIIAVDDEKLKMNLDVAGFSAFNDKNSRIDSKYTVNKINNYTSEVEFREWSLPGSGYSMYLIKQNGK